MSNKLDFALVNVLMGEHGRIADQVKTLDEASEIELGFPYDLYGKELPRTFMYGGMEKQILV